MLKKIFFVLHMHCILVYEFCCHYERHLVHWKNIVWPSSALRVWRENVQHGRCAWQFSQNASSTTRWSTAMVPTLARFNVLVNLEFDETCDTGGNVDCCVCYNPFRCISSLDFLLLFYFFVTTALPVTLLATALVVDSITCFKWSLSVFTRLLLCESKEWPSSAAFCVDVGKFVSLSWNVFRPSRDHTRRFASLMSLIENCNVECSAVSAD